MQPREKLPDWDDEYPFSSILTYAEGSGGDTFATKDPTFEKQTNFSKDPCLRSIGTHVS